MMSVEAWEKVCLTVFSGVEVTIAPHLGKPGLYGTQYLHMGKSEEQVWVF